MNIESDFVELDDRMKKVEGRVDDMYKLLLKLEGASTLIRGLFYIVAPIGAFIYWLKDHVKL